MYSAACPVGDRSIRCHRDPCDYIGKNSCRTVLLFDLGKCSLYEWKKRFVVYSVDVRSLAVKLTDGALASDLFCEAYHSSVGEFRLSDSLELPMRWMAVELLEAVVDSRTAVYEPATDVVRSVS